MHFYIFYRGKSNTIRILIDVLTGFYVYFISLEGRVRILVLLMVILRRHTNASSKFYINLLNHFVL